jgi:hypothetical protein
VRFYGSTPRFAVASVARFTVYQGFPWDGFPQHAALRVRRAATLDGFTGGCEEPGAFMSRNYDRPGHAREKAPGKDQPMRIFEVSRSNAQTAAGAPRCPSATHSVACSRARAIWRSACPLTGG